MLFQCFTGRGEGGGGSTWPERRRPRPRGASRAAVPHGLRRRGLRGLRFPTPPGSADPSDPPPVASVTPVAAGVTPQGPGHGRPRAGCTHLSRPPRRGCRRHGTRRASGLGEARRLHPGERPRRVPARPASDPPCTAGTPRPPHRRTCPSAPPRGPPGPTETLTRRPARRDQNSRPEEAAGSPAPSLWARPKTPPASSRSLAQPCYGGRVAFWVL